MVNLEAVALHGDMMHVIAVFLVLTGCINDYPIVGFVYLLKNFIVDNYM